MAIAKITGPGLAAIGVSVVLLWGCVIGQRAMVRRALSERFVVMREIRKMQRRLTPEPVSLPSHRTPHRLRVTAG